MWILQSPTTWGPEDVGGMFVIGSIVTFMIAIGLTLALDWIVSAIICYVDDGDMDNLSYPIFGWFSKHEELSNWLMIGLLAFWPIRILSAFQPLVLLVVGVCFLLLKLARFSRRTQKVLVKHITDKSIHNPGGND